MTSQSCSESLDKLKGKDKQVWDEVSGKGDGSAFGCKTKAQCDSLVKVCARLAPTGMSLSCGSGYRLSRYVVYLEKLA